MLMQLVYFETLYPLHRYQKNDLYHHVVYMSPKNNTKPRLPIVTVLAPVKIPPSYWYSPLSACRNTPFAVTKDIHLDYDLHLHVPDMLSTDHATPLPPRILA